jgi:hypothetical protein
MEATKTAVVTITTRKEFTCKVEYDTLEDLVSSVNELFIVEDEYLITLAYSARITLPECDGGCTFAWNVNLAHVCFDKGRITEAQFVEELFKPENAI